MKIRSVIAAAAAACVLAAGSVTAFADGAADNSVSPEEAADYSNVNDEASTEDAPVENEDAPVEGEDEDEDAEVSIVTDDVPAESSDIPAEDDTENTSSDETTYIMPISDDTAADDSALDNPDTGFEGVAAIIGAVALAGAAIVMSRKKD